MEEEHAKLVSAFAAAGVANEPTLELFLPLARYKRLLGAAQLNAFELSLSSGATVSALLPGIASCFNHSCEPNVLISCDLGPNPPHSLSTRAFHWPEVACTVSCNLTTCCQEASLAAALFTASLRLPPVRPG